MKVQSLLMIAPNYQMTELQFQRSDKHKDSCAWISKGNQLLRSFYCLWHAL